MTFEEFAGTPAIGIVHELRIRRPKELGELEQFRDELVIMHTYGRGDIYDGEERIASFVVADRNGDTRLWVHESWRRDRGGWRVADELVYAVVLKHGGPLRSSLRTAASQAVYRRVWERMQHELQQILAA